MSTIKVNFPSENRAGAGQGVLIGDASRTPRGLIVIHEWWGMTQQIQDEAKQIASEGRFTVLVCDVYRGKVATDNEEAMHNMSGLDWNGAIQDISGAAKYLHSLGCPKVGVTGFCMGGGLAFAAAALCPEISAAAPFYGTPRPGLADLTTIRIPVQGHYGDLDEVAGFSSPDKYNAINEQLLTAGVPFELCVYHAGHAFTNINSPTYNREACQLAFKRLYEFMGKHLQTSHKI